MPVLARSRFKNQLIRLLFKQNMKELSPLSSFLGMGARFALLLIIIPRLLCASCNRERCCALTICTPLYCQQQSSQTWISTQSYDKYQYTKLVLAGNECKPCAYNCKKCSAESTCIECHDGYYLQAGSRCLPCEYKCLKCQLVNNLSKCSVCDEGAYLDTTSLSCKICPVGAKSCVDSTNIVECNPGYLKSSNSLFCTSCISNCLSCPTSTAFCSVCAPSYFPSSGLCRICTIPNCANCQAVGSAVYCSQCSEGYYRANSSSCSACSQNCKVCSNLSVCSGCKTGYFIQAGGCTPVSVTIASCSAYSNVTVNGTNKCLGCASGYYLSTSSLQCIPCSITCTSCYGDHFGKCTSCISTAKLFNQMCIPANYVDGKKMQIYYTPAANAGDFVGGSLMCSSLLYSGAALAFSLNNIAAYKLVINYRLFTDLPSQQYSISINSTSDSNSTQTASRSLNFSSSSQSYQICPPSTTSYYSHISSATFTGLKLRNSIAITSFSSSLLLYLSQLLITAFKCASLCLECSQTQCFTCITSNLYKQDAYCVYVCGNGYYTYEDEKECVKQCPLGTYGLLTNISCMACVSPCVTCLNDKYCLSCEAGYFLSPLTHSCQKQCPFRYYGSIKTQKCEQCVGRCDECSTEQQCLSCRVGFLQNKTCVEICQAGYYENLKTLKCEKCSSTCLTCSYSLDYCLSCPASQYRYNNTCVSTCLPGYFPSQSTRICQICLYPCQLCASGPTICESCVDGYLLHNTCYPSCPPSFYQENVELKCLPCPPECRRCFSSVTCLECESGYVLHKSECILVCPAGYYAEKLTNTTVAICSKCVGLCSSCSNQTYCLTCNSNFLASNGSGICLRSTLCSISQYANINSLKCEPCSPQCSSCYVQSTSCTACFSGLVLFNGSCLSNCPSSYYFRSQGSMGGDQCVVCEQPCLSCIDENRCLSCIHGYKYSSVANLCSSTCSIGSYFNSTINDCTPCSTNCLNCQNQMFCYVCGPKTYLNVLSSTQNECITQCPHGHYPDTLTCMKCLFPCDLCSSSIDCISCQNGVLYQSRCISACPQSTFLNATSNTCQNCLSPCLTCKSAPSFCTSCKTGLYFIQPSAQCSNVCPLGTYAFSITQSCLACPEACSNCLNSSFCTDCIAGKTYLNKETHLCLEFCAAGSYGSSDTGACQPCQPKCQTCSSSSQCLSCSPGYLLIRLENARYDCVRKCPLQYYNDSNICYRCSFPCLECNSPSQCSSCAPGTFFHNYTRSCLLSCPLGTYYVNAPNMKCLDCHPPCATCKSPTACVSCVSGYLLNEGSCVLQCPSSFYADGSGICNRCYGVCKTCSSKYECLTCQTGYAYSGYCYSACPPGTYASEITKKCEPCQSPCLECTNSPTYCKKCQFNMFAYRGICSSACPMGTWASGEVCVSCQFPCIRCSNQFTCEQCIGGYLLYMRKSCIVNQDRCPNDLYKLNSKECVPSTWCPATYYRDENIKTCSSSCSRDKYVNKVERTCLANCSSGEYVGAEMNCKNWLVQPPLSLMEMTSIVFIKSSEIHIVVNFNQTFDWLDNSESLFELRSGERSRRLLSSQLGRINYTLLSAQQLVLKIAEMPYDAQLTLPAYYVKSTVTSYNLQTPTITVSLPSFTAYSYEQVYIGSVMKEFSQGISWFIILFSMFFLFMNRLSDAYVLWDTSQLLYLLVFLNIQYPPNLNDFLLGLSNINFLFVPSIFQNTIGSLRFISSAPFYAYSNDCSFLRTAGSPILLIVIVFSIFLVLKLIETVSKRSEWIKNKLDEHPKVKKNLFKALMRFRWHHTSDVFFLTYDIIVLFAVAEIYNISKNPHNFVSNAVSALFLAIYLAFPCFVTYKLYKHFNNISKGKLVANLQCFYRGIEKTNKFGIFLILIRYFRKITYGIIIGVFTEEPMFALPILMFTSVLLGLFMFINKPFKKKLSNIITIGTEAALVVVYILIAIVQFGDANFTQESKMVLGWVCCGFLLIIHFSLIFQIFCKSMFYLESEKQGQNAGGKAEVEKQIKKIPNNLSQQYLRQKAGQFFDRMFPRLKRDLNLDDSEETLNNYEQGDSQNSENNEEREQSWGVCREKSQRNSDQFRHYGVQSQKSQANQEIKKAPNYLIRCVKQLK